ncbi:MAG: hypothetical protein GPJ54_14205 [Candidatus Heimdallarchaeota archaeon]|nr:hypothetical protein [Candidatus Heimdallarchaeota archaeon]
MEEGNETSVRHVILGSDTTLGSSILRVLVSIGNQEIVCCNPDGMIPIDVPTTNITTFNVDVRNSQMLEAILQEGDVVYNAQVFDDENVISQDFEKLHVSGLKNILKVANQKNVKKVVSFLPQKISWNIPDKASEATELIPFTNYQKSLHKTLQMTNLYFEQTLFEDVIIENENEDEVDIDNGTSDETESAEHEEISVNEVSDEEIESQEIVSSSPKPPSLQVTPPSLGNSSTSTDSSDEKQSPIADDPTLIEDNQENSLEVDISEEEPKYDVPLVVARISRFYGPFDYTITKKVCQGIRLQRISIVGKLRKKISWINPLDAGRAMIIMGDDKVKQGPYNITGFEATGSELIEAMEQINYSKTKIRRKLFFISNINTKIKMVFSKLGIINRIEFDEIYGLNRKQVYSDQRAQSEWNWKPKYDLTVTSKDSLNWFVNHVL